MYVVKKISTGFVCYALTYLSQYAPTSFTKYLTNHVKVSTVFSLV